jgi:hypothetical protein
MEAPPSSQRLIMMAYCHTKMAYVRHSLPTITHVIHSQRNAEPPSLAANIHRQRQHILTKS